MLKLVLNWKDLGCIYNRKIATEMQKVALIPRAGLLIIIVWETVLSKESENGARKAVTTIESPHHMDCIKQRPKVAN